MIKDADKFPPLFEELGHEEIAPHVFRQAGKPGGGGMLSAEKTWEILRANRGRQSASAEGKQE